MNEIRTSNDLNSTVYKDGLYIRTTVFVDEQNVPPELEIDEFEDKCTYNTLYVNGAAAATARYFPTDDNGIHVQRVAVLKKYRKKGLASELLKHIMKQAQENSYDYIILGAQDQANGFYKKLGFEVIGDQYLDAGILHHDMRIEL
ncbi:GNAT family N-acetyltransferase [Companilactobacillus mishanensis]|uniref:GNAT family N-acetyltransferase n=1 Tax=Companilactobacillus mishanensis TaxID=2486008 RepID=A0A5P0ZFH6_9LACO|nr:GNAT family N-acetyltransferase [Companilactobacillus mishanensis]MQS45941.1 GNAT family N-acetyltransferase [Companilactobacillus mishanensis]MQS51796.1 GNAT family N-acetyltransferase [Companilactobacillus mishanensis]